MAMRIAVGQSPILTDEYLTFARQIGAAGVQLNTPAIPGDQRWQTQHLMALRKQVEDAGLRLEAIENVPNHFYDHIMLGLPGRDRQITNMIATIEALGQAGIGILGMNWMPQSVWRTELGPLARGGANASAYNHTIATDPAARDRVWVARRDQHIADAKDSWVRGSFIDTPAAAVDENTMWTNLTYFLDAALPAAERAGVILAFHPDDPPVPEIDGVARIFTSIDAIVTAMTTHPSPALAVALCLGTISEMGGQDAVLDAIRRLGALHKIAYVHLRDVTGTIPQFTETFLGRGNYQPHHVIQALRQVGFDGFILDDHTPGLVGDDPYGYRGRAHALGYIQALIDATEGVNEA